MIAVLLSYLPLLLLTLAIESALVAAVARRGSRRSAVSACLALNLLTHPMATLFAWRWQVDVLALELLVFLFEWLGYAQLMRLRLVPALRYAFLPNLTTAIVGVGLWMARMAA